jgi:hypothetical protein
MINAYNISKEHYRENMKPILLVQTLIFENLHYRLQIDSTLLQNAIINYKLLVFF